MATTLPRGIQLVPYKDKFYYRVRINRKATKDKKAFKVSKYFQDVNEAKEFLALSKAVKGKQLIYSIEEKNKEANKTERKEDFTIGYYIDRYIEDYLSKEFDTELEKRNQSNKLSFLKTIKNTSVLDRQLSNEEKEDLGIDTELDKKTYRFFGGLDIRKIKAIDINNYIKSRLPFVKPVSVSRELTFISNIYRKLQYFNEELADIPNPALLFDRDLLKNRTTKREVILTEEDEQKVYEVLTNRANQEMFLIAKCSILTGMRRSEIVYLKQSQVKDVHIELSFTKSGRPRKVYLTAQAKEFLNSLKVHPNGRFFDYTISGFGKLFSELMIKNNLSHFHFHDLRRTNISRLLTKLGDNTILATEILGIQSVKKFEELHYNSTPKEPLTQQQAVKNWHSSIQVTKGYYNIVFKQPIIKTD